MKILLDLPEETLSRLQTLADLEKRSRKQYMEIVLIDHKKIIKGSSEKIDNSKKESCEGDKKEMPAGLDKSQKLKWLRENS